MLVCTLLLQLLPRRPSDKGTDQRNEYVHTQIHWAIYVDRQLLISQLQCCHGTSDSAREFYAGWCEYVPSESHSLLHLHHHL